MEPDHEGSEAVLYPFHRCDGSLEGWLLSPWAGAKTFPREAEAIRLGSDSHSPCLKAATPSPPPWPSASGR